MRNKKKVWKYIIYVCIVIVALFVVLVFVPKSDEKGDDGLNDIPTEETVPPAEDDVEDPHIPDDEIELPKEEIYATSLVLNLPTTINILIGTTVNLISGYVVVEPAELMNKLNVEIVPRYNSSSFGLKLSNSVLTGKEVGSYNINFSIDKSATNKITKTTTVYVYEEKENAHLSQLKDDLILGEDYSINSIFSLNSNSDYSVAVDDKMNFANGKFSPVTVGESSVLISFVEEFLKYNYSFEFYIKEGPLYAIVLNNVVNNTVNLDLIENDILKINYVVKNRDEERVNQKVYAISDNENVVRVGPIDDLFIELIAVSNGEANITIILAEDSEIKVEFKAIVN